MFDIEIWPKNLYSYIKKLDEKVKKNEDLQENYENVNEISDCSYEISRELKNLLPSMSYKTLDNSIKLSIQRGFNNFSLCNLHFIIKPVNLELNSEKNPDEVKEFYKLYNEEFLNFDKNLDEGMILEDINYKNMTHGAVRACIATFMSNLLRDKRLIEVKFSFLHIIFKP